MLEIGETLREARSRRGLDLLEAEAGTMIRARYLEALEEDRFDLLPGGAYRRSFLREYAGFLGLDGELLVDEYQLRFEPLEPEPLAPPRSRVAWLEDLPVGRALAIAAVVAVFGVAVWQLGGTGGHAPSPPVAHAAAPRPRHVATPPAQPPARRPAAKTAPVLTLTAARGSCWVLVRIGSSAGSSVYEQTLQQGETVRFGLRKTLWIRLGAPWNLTATIGKRVVDSSLPASTGDALATAAGVRPAAP